MMAPPSRDRCAPCSPMRSPSVGTAASAAGASTCCITNCIDPNWREPGGPSSVGTPANVATSASPVQSTKTLPVTARGPRLVASTSACTPPWSSTTTSATSEWSSTSSVSSSVTRWSARRLTAHGTYKKTAVSLNGTGPTPAPSLARASAISRAIPPTTKSNSPASSPPTYKPQIVPTLATVRLPPRNPYRSQRTTRAPAREAASAAPRPAGPPPATTTSASARTSASRSGTRTAGRYRRSLRRALTKQPGLGLGAPAVGVVLGAGWEAVPRAPPHDSAAPAAPTPTDRNPESREASTGPPRALSDFVSRRVTRRTQGRKSPGVHGSGIRAASPAAVPPEVTARGGARTGRRPPRG